MLPFSLTCSVSCRCNSRCLTCNIHKKEPIQEFSVTEWEKTFRSLGKAPVWITFSGGEPFLRTDLVAIVAGCYDICRPSIINIPTNGLLCDDIPCAVKEIAQHCRRARIVINVSIDGIGDENDYIRGVPGSYEKAVKTFDTLMAISEPNVSVGIHTVISRFNAQRFTDICSHLLALKPDSYVTEIAEERRELDTLDTGIAPSLEDYSAAVDFLVREMKKETFDRIGRLTRAFRTEYYRMVKRFLQTQRQNIPCYAGTASAQIAPDGDVWMCCVLAEAVGNLRQAAYDFPAVWYSGKAAAARRSIQEGECSCPLANAAYTNMLHSPISMCRVLRNLVLPDRKVL